MISCPEFFVVCLLHLQIKDCGCLGMLRGCVNFKAQLKLGLRDHPSF